MMQFSVIILTAVVALSAGQSDYQTLKGTVGQNITLNIEAHIEHSDDPHITWSSGSGVVKVNYANGKLIKGDPKKFHLDPKTGALTILSLSANDAGLYEGQTFNGRGPFRFNLTVGDPPRLPSVSVRPSGKIMEGSSVTLTCSSDANPAANYTWYKENQTLIQGPVYHLTSISSADSGNYSCKSENEYGSINSASVHIDVLYPPKLPSVSVSPSGEIVEGSSVNLTCSSDANPAANYTWYKENEDSPKASGQIFTITDVRAEHSGNYTCEVWNNLGRHNSTLHLNVVSGSWKSVASGSITALLLVIIFLSAFFLIRRRFCPKRRTTQARRQTASSRQTAERSDGRTQLNMDLECENPSEELDDLCDARVSFSKNQEDPLDSNISPAQLNGHQKKKKKGDPVEYTAVDNKHAGASPQKRQSDSG